VKIWRWEKYENCKIFLGPKNGVVMTFGENGQFFLLKITENVKVTANGRGAKVSAESMYIFNL